MRLIKSATWLLRVWTASLIVILSAGCSREHSTMPADSLELSAESAAQTAAPASEEPQQQTFEELTNSRFSPELNELNAVPKATAIELKTPDVGSAIWGATGCDNQGHVWFAVSPFEGEERSARLYEYDPSSGATTERGDVLSEARKAEIYTAGMQQPKIHTKIIQASDGHLYFVSSNENPRDVVGRKPPQWGSHLWRVRMPERQWEHLAAWEEGVLALAGGGSALYCLAFPDHTLIRYDIATGQSKKVKVGSVEGHISRNLLVGGNGAAYVPRLTMTGPDVAEHTLVAFDADLKEVGSHQLPYYQQASEEQPASLADQFHGITGFCYLADESIAFTTHSGRLFRLTPEKGKAGKLDELGWLHPDGKSYASSLWTLGGSRYVYGLPMIVRNNHDDHDLVRFDLIEKKSQVLDLELVEGNGASLVDSGLYGSNTRDGEGALIAAGGYSAAGGMRPVVLRIEWDGSPAKRDE